MAGATASTRSKPRVMTRMPGSPPEDPWLDSWIDRKHLRALIRTYGLDPRNELDGEAGESSERFY